MGLRRIVSVGLMRDWVRYSIFLPLCLLLLGGFITTFVEVTLRFFILQFTLGVAFLMNGAERLAFLYYVCRNHDRKEKWDFCSDIIRPFATEIFVYIALVTILFYETEELRYIYDPSVIYIERNTSGPYSNYSTSGISMIVFLAVLFILTAFIIRNFVVFSITWSLLKRKEVDNSKAAFSQKLFLYGLRVHTIAQSVVQALLIIFIGLMFQWNELPGRPHVDFFAFLAVVAILPTASWFLYFSTALPYVQLFPISMLVDLPPGERQNDGIDKQEVSSQFRVMHRHAMTYKGVCINLLLIFAHPIQCVLHILFFAADGYALYFLLYASFFSPHSSTYDTLIGCVTFILLLLVNFPMFFYGFLMSVFLPILVPMYCILYFVMCPLQGTAPGTASPYTNMHL